MTNTASSAPDNSGVRIFPPGVYILGLVIGYLIQWAWPLRIVDAGWIAPLRVLGVILLLLWIGLAAWALSTFSRAGTPVNPRETVTTVARDGPYRFTRNPMYLSMALGLAGFAFVGNALWPLLALIPVIWIIQVMVIDKEERYLERKFGEDYLDLKRSVRRWI